MILIRNAKIIDGTGAPERHGDVLISGASISAIGSFPHKKTETVIDALGQRLAPGYIDIRTETGALAELFGGSAPSAARAEGFTTLVGGTDGSSLAPLFDGSLDQFKKWGGANGMNTNWRTMAEFRRAFNRTPRGINFGTLAGYNTVRRTILHENGGDPTDKEQGVITYALEEALHEGALGIGINLDTAHGKRIPHNEVHRAALLAAKKGVLLALKPRAWGEHFMEAASEIIALYRATGVRILLVDFLPRELNKAEEIDFRRAHEALSAAGDGIFMEVRYATSQLLPIYELLPRFARTGTLRSMRALLDDKSQRKKILMGLPRLEGMRITRTTREHTALIGTTLESFATNRGITGKEALIELMRLTGLEATVAIPQKESLLSRELMRDARVLVSGNPQSVFKAADETLLPPETAVMKLTGLPASVLNLTKRGIVCENYAADLVLMDDRNTVTHAIVNGKIHGTGGICVNH